MENSALRSVYLEGDGMEEEKIAEPSTFRNFCQEMIAYAKEVQGENYAGDDYYMQDCWREYFIDGDTAKDAVDSDMSNWD